MTSGQSEAHEQIKGDILADFYAYIRRQVAYGTPGLTPAEQRMVVEMLTGEKLPPLRARCPRCNNDGCDYCHHYGVN